MWAGRCLLPNESNTHWTCLFGHAVSKHFLRVGIWKKKNAWWQIGWPAPRTQGRRYLVSWSQPRSDPCLTPPEHIPKGLKHVDQCWSPRSSLPLVYDFLAPRTSQFKYFDSIELRRLGLFPRLFRCPPPLPKWASRPSTTSCCLCVLPTNVASARPLGFISERFPAPIVEAGEPGNHSVSLWCLSLLRSFRIL